MVTTEWAKLEREAGGEGKKKKQYLERIHVIYIFLKEQTKQEKEQKTQHKGSNKHKANE